MSQTEKTTILRAFIAEKLAPLGCQLDDESFFLLESQLTLSEAGRPEREEIRSVDLKTHTDGKVSAGMFSLYQVSQISLNDLFGLALKEAGVLMMHEDTKIKITLAFLAVVHDFFKLLNIELNESEARVLLAVYDIDKPAFSAADIKEAYRQRFVKPISADRLDVFLDAFVRMTILGFDKRTALYAKRQRIHLNR